MPMANNGQSVPQTAFSESSDEGQSLRGFKGIASPPLSVWAAAEKVPN